MITKAVILFALIIVFALLFFFSFVSTIIGFIKKQKKLWTMGLVVCLFSACLFSLTTIYTSTKGVKRTFVIARTFIEEVDNRITEYIDPSPSSRFTGLRFTGLTGLEWPKSAKIITIGDDFWVFDWEYYIVFETDREVLDTWLSNPPPWGVEKWVAGPIPSKIPYGIDGSDIKISSSDNIWYAAKEYCCDDNEYLRFHSGDLFIIDLDTNTVLLKSWDY